MHGHSFEQFWTKFGMWHRYTIRMVMGQLANATRARRLALHAWTNHTADSQLMDKLQGISRKMLYMVYKC